MIVSGIIWKYLPWFQIIKYEYETNNNFFCINIMKKLYSCKTFIGLNWRYGEYQNTFSFICFNLFLLEVISGVGIRRSRRIWIKWMMMKVAHNYNFFYLFHFPYHYYFYYHYILVSLFHETALTLNEEMSGRMKLHWSHKCLLLLPPTNAWFINKFWLSSSSTPPRFHVMVIIRRRRTTTLARNFIRTLCWLCTTKNTC